MNFKLLPNIYFFKAFIVLASILGVRSQAAAFTLPSDTLIIDGKTVQVEVKEGEEETEPQEEIPYDSLASQVFRTKLLGLSYNRGFSFNKISSNSTASSLDEFTGNQTTVGSFQKSEINFLVETQKNVWLGASFGLTNWNIKHSSYTEDLGENFWGFESIEDNSLNQINFFPVQFGGEFDTVKVNLGAENYITAHYNFGLKVGKEFLKKKSSERTQFIGLLGVNIQKMHSYTLDSFQFINETSLYSIDARELEKNQTELSTSLELLIIHRVNEKISIIPSAIFTQQLTPAFIKGSAINYGRRGLGLGLSLSWNF